MSDMYLVLRSRLEDVQSWTTLGPDVMRDAQDRQGLSDERAARQVPVSTRTWIRWRQRGEVPTHSLERVAAVLDLEVERPAARRVQVEQPPADLSVRLEALEDEVRELRLAVTEGFEAMRVLLERPQRTKAAAGRRRPA